MREPPTDIDLNDVLLRLDDVDAQLIRLRKELPRATGAHRHAVLDLMVGLLFEREESADEHETMARELLAIDRDRTHLLALARVLERRSRPDEASALRREAAEVPDHHLTNETRQLAESVGLRLVDD